MKKLWKAIKAKLVANAGLVTLAGYSSSNLNICRGYPSVKGFPKGLFFEEQLTLPLSGANTSKIKKTDVIFLIANSDELTCSDLADYFEGMFENINLSKCFLDFSNTDVYCIWSRIISRGKVVVNEELGFWECEVRVEIEWCLK